MATTGQPQLPDYLEQVHAPRWELIDHRWDPSPTGCQHCGTSIKRVYLLQHSETDQLLLVGRTCAREFGIVT